MQGSCLRAGGDWKEGRTTNEEESNDTMGGKGTEQCKDAESDGVSGAKQIGINNRVEPKNRKKMRHNRNTCGGRQRKAIQV